MPLSPERHQHCIRNNFSEKLNLFANKIEVHLKSNKSNSINPFNINVEKGVISVPPTKSPNSPENQVIAEPSTTNQVITEPSINHNNDCSVKNRVNTDNSIIHTMDGQSTIIVVDEVSNFKLNSKVLYQGTKATITVTLPREDEFLEPVYKLVYRLGKSKIVKHDNIVLNLLTILSDISCYKSK